MWWPFAKRGSRIESSPTFALPVALPADLGVFGINDTCIKLWLPEKLVCALSSLSTTYEMSRPDVLRCLLFEHVYGRPALERLREWKLDWDAKRRSATDETRFCPRESKPSERTVTTQLLGKSVEDFKLWLAEPLKAELAKLAIAEGLGLSDYIRKTLVRLLLGEAFHHQWRAALGTLSAEVRRLEDGQTI